jgi:hypothetical protein
MTAEKVNRQNNAPTAIGNANLGLLRSAPLACGADSKRWPNRDELIHTVPGIGGSPGR